MNFQRFLAGQFDQIHCIVVKLTFISQRHHPDDSISSKRSDRHPPSIFSDAGSDAFGKKPRRQHANTESSDHGVAKAGRKSGKNQPNPEEDPDYKRFQEQMDDLKNFTLPVQDRDDYYHEVNATDDRNFEDLVFWQREKHGDGYSLAGHEAKLVERTQRRRDRKKAVSAATAMPSIGEQRESDFEDETPISSTPLGTSKKPRHHHRSAAGVSHIAEVSPPSVASFRRPSRRSSPAKRLASQRPSVPKHRDTEMAPVVSTPLDRLRRKTLRLDVSAVQERSPSRPQQNLSREFQAALEESSVRGRKRSTRGGGARVDSSARTERASEVVVEKQSTKATTSKSRRASEIPAASSRLRSGQQSGTLFVVQRMIA